MPLSANATTKANIARAGIAGAVRVSFLAAVGLALLAATSGASAAAQRVFVASYGNDANPCSRAQPCRTLAVAAGAVIAGGEIVPLDSAGYGPIAIYGSLSIVAPDDVVAMVTTSGTVGLDLAPVAGATVSIRGLRVRVEGGGAPAIRVSARPTAMVSISRVTASSPGSPALQVQDGDVHVSESAFVDSRFGVLIDSYADRVVLENVRVEGNAWSGVVVGGFFTMPRVEIAGSSIAGNGVCGVEANGSTVSVTGSMLAHNQKQGVCAVAAQDFCDDERADGWHGISGSSAVGNGDAGIRVVGQGCFSNGAVTVTANLVASNAATGIVMDGAYLVTSRARMQVGANTVADNGGAGIAQTGPANAYTRRDNAVLQATPVSGTLTQVPPY